MNSNVIVCLITGPAGAGKSSVANMLAKKFDKSAVINVDQIRSMVVGGYMKPWPWSEEVKMQTRLAAKNACTLANNYIESGFNVIIDDVIGESLFKQYTEFFGKKIKVFLLLPALNVLLDRFDGRGKDDELRIRTHDLHKKFISKKDDMDWRIIDSSDQTIADTTDLIFQELLKSSSD